VDTTLGLAALGHSGLVAADPTTGALSGNQWGMVDAVVLNFTTTVSMTAADLSISLHQNVTVNGVPGQTAGTLPTLSVVTFNVAGATTAVITFSGAGVSFSSIADGVYDLSYDGNIVTFGRLFGDVTGSTVTDANGGLGSSDPTQNHGNIGVAAADKLQFNNAFNTTVGQAAYRSGFDSNSDGVISAADKLKFTPNFNKSFVW
jgi:hypothetical protein